MRPRFLALLLFLGMTFTSLCADEKGENPLKKAKVGDFLVYTMGIKGQANPSTIRQTVTEVTDKEVTIETQITANGKELPASKSKLDLTQHFDPAAMGKNKVEVKKLDSGKETLTINGKEYACEWVKTKSTTKVNNKDFTAEAKIWTCKDVPLTGVVKVETMSDFNNSTMELVEFGAKK